MTLKITGSQEKVCLKLIHYIQFYIKLNIIFFQIINFYIIEEFFIWFD